MNYNNKTNAELLNHIINNYGTKVLLDFLKGKCEENVDSMYDCFRTWAINLLETMPYNTIWDNGNFEEIMLEVNEFDMFEIEELLKSHGCKVKWGDNGYDDGCDEDDDEYIMYQSCDITDAEGETRWVKFYYGNLTNVIGYYQIM